MKYLIIRLIDGTGFVSRAIDFIERGYLCHAEIGTPEGTWIGAHADGGVQERPANYCTPTRDLRYYVPVTDEQYERIMAFARSQIGKPYDFSDIAGILLNADWHKAGAWICSEFVVAACMAGGLHLLNVEIGYTYRITPDKVHLSPWLMGHLRYHFDKELTPQLWQAA
jgi:uncharacterized protein YycO